MWSVMIGILVYLLAPIVAAAVLKKLFNDSSRFLSLIGIACGPLLVSLMQYFLLAIIPGKDPWLYPLLIGVTFVSLGIWSRRFIGLKRIAWRRPTFNLNVIFVGLVVTFVFVRMVVYPPAWGDVYEYTKQAYVYSQDRGLWRTNTGIPFMLDSTPYIINPAIRPAIPMFDSLFFLVAKPTPEVLIMTQFLYFYYFVLLLLTVSYGGKLLGLNRLQRIWPVVLSLSCFYLIRFTIYGAKEIILMVLSTLSLLALYQLGKSKNTEWKYLILMGMTMGLGSFINFSGTLIALIIGLLFVFWVRYALKMRLVAAIILAVITLMFGGLEPWNGVANFVFIPTPLALGTTSVDAAKVRQTELANYQLSENEVLWRGKLQAFTQPQFFGLVYSIWLIILVIAWRKGHAFTDLEKLLLLYIGIYFLIIMDPFNLNPHPYAYVLAISPKYSLMLLPMLALTMTGRLKTILYIQTKIPKNFIYCFGMLIPLLLPDLRSFLGEQGTKIIAVLMPLTNSHAYYLSLLNSLMLCVGIASLLITITARYWQRHYVKIAVIGLLMLPTLFLLYSNFLR